VSARELWSNLTVFEQQTITLTLGGARDPGWDFSVADSGFLEMYHSDIAEIGGAPGILYAVEFPGQTESRYVSALDVAGSAWNEYGLLDIGVPSMMRLSDIIELDGRPAVCTCDVYLIGGRVNYLHALDADGSLWPEPFETQTTVSAPIIDFGGKPAMLYFNAHQATQLEFRVADDAAGAAWDTTSQMSPAQMQLIYELVMLEGRPAAVCFGGDKPIYRASDSSAQNWELTGIVPVPSNGDGQRARVSVLNDRLILAYVTGNGEDRHLEFAGALDPNGSSWNGPANLGFVASDFVFDLAPVDGRPAVVLQGPEYDLRLALAEDANGAAWAEPIVVSNYGSVGSAVSMDLVDGQPAIATFNRSTGDLEYYRRKP
jgi:hypothetical protein